MKLVALFLAFAAVPFCQSTGTASTKGICSPAVTGSNNTFSITCGIGKQQGQKMIEILNRILADRLDPDAVMKKLDEILHAVNPNLPAKTYFCDGRWRSIGPSANSALDVQMGGDDTAFQEMLRLYNSKQYGQAIKLCLSQIQSTPEWLTPRLVCAVSYLAQGSVTEAKEMLNEFDRRTGPAYDTDGCKQMSDFLHARLP